MRFRNFNRDMNELEDTKCEVRRTIDLHFPIWERTNVSSEDDGGTQLGSAGYNVNPLGNFFEDATYAWLSCGPRLVVVNVKTGVGISSWTFRDRVTCVSQFPSQPGQIPLLLVGLDNGANKVRDSSGIVCVFDCTASQVLRAIRVPAGIEQACVVFGGAEWEDFGGKRINTVLGECSGIACVVLRNLDHLLIDLRRRCWEGPEATVVLDEANPAELNFIEENEETTSRHKSRKEKHAAFNLMNSYLEQCIGFNRGEFEATSIVVESLTSSLICSRKIGCLVSGCLGRVIIWETDGDVKWISTPLDENMSITHLALIEPTDDPRPFCYLWSAYEDETCRSPPVLRMHAMLFERKYTDKGINSYLNLVTDPSVKFELELDENEKIMSLCPIVRDNNSEQTDSSYKRGEDSVLLIGMETRAILFDLNQWYKEQMPHTIGECNNQNAIIANYRTRPEIVSISDDTIINCAYVPETLKEFPCNDPTPAEELFYPNSLSLEWIDLSTSRLTYWSTRGVQAELLREIFITGPVIMIEPSETYHRCAAAGLLSTNGEISTINDKDLQREALLSLCLEQRWSQFLVKCAKEWSDGSASYLFHSFLRWGMQRASSIKLTVDRLCVPLYDQSGAGIGETEVKQLRFYCQQLECITNVVTNLPIDSVDLTREKRALRRVATYLRVLLWFYDVGLLPESQEIEDDSSLPMSFSLRIPYPYERLAAIYRDKRREFGKTSTKNTSECEEDMFIDELVNRECTSLKLQWEREGAESSIGGYYPPSSLQSLLRSFLTDCRNSSDLDEMEKKHQITIYLLMDLAMLLQNSCPSVDQLIKYPSAFKLSPSLIKLTQAFWLLDHEDHHGFLDMMTGQLISDSDVKDWHHRLVMRTLIRNNQNKLALIYLRVRKPPLSSIDEQSTVISLSVEHGLVQSAFHRRPPSHYAQLLTSFYRACKNHGKLNDILHLALDHEEEEAFVKFLESEKIEDTRLLYYLQRCRYAEAGNVSSLGSAAKSNYIRNNDKSASSTIFNAYNATLPDITRKFSANIVAKASSADPTARYPRPMSHRKSRVKTRDIHEIVMRKARETFLRGDRSRIPFVSVPCVTLKSKSSNVDANSVLFVQRLKKPGGKRSLDEMRGDDRENIDSEEDDRKRRRITESTERRENLNDIDREIGRVIAFDTPLVKRKKQIVNAKNTAVETPHSILKIRQMIRDSTSPCRIEPIVRETTEQRMQDRERKRRQIRFSLGQQRNNDETTIDDGDLTGDKGETKNDPEETEEEDVEAERPEIQVDLVNDDDSEEEEMEEAYYSPNASTKSSYEPTLLSDSSSLTINVSGPRPRPSLRRSNESTSFDMRKTLEKASESATASSAISLTKDKDAENDGSSPVKMNEERDSFSKTSYTASILSSDTSLERTSPIKRTLPHSLRENTFSFSEKSIEKCRDLSALPLCSIEGNDHFRRFTQIATRRSSIRKSSVFTEFIGDPDDDKNSEILTEVDGFGLDRESTDQSPVKNNWDIDSNTDRMDNIVALAKHNLTEITDIVVDENLEERGEKEDEDGNKNEEADHGESVSEVSPGLRVSEDDEENGDEIEEEMEIENREGESEKDEDEQDESDAEEIVQKENDEDEIEENVDNSTEVRESLSKDLENPEFEIAKPTNDDDDELLTLRYEEENVDDDDADDDDDDNDDVYQSLSNSMEIASARSKSSSERSIVSGREENEEMKKSTDTSINNGCYDVPKISCHDAHITDDESSRSVDGSELTVGSTSAKCDLDKTVSVERIQPDIIDEASNITNDDSSSSFDSSLFSVKRPSQDLANAANSLVESNKTTNDDRSSPDSSLFSTKKTKSIAKDSQNVSGAKDESEGKERNSSNASETLTSNATDVSEILKDSTEERDADDAEEASRPRKKGKRTIGQIGRIKVSESPEKNAEIQTPTRKTRSQRATSVIHEQSPAIQSPITRSSTSARLRRASSLAKDFITPLNENSPVATPTRPELKSSRLRRSISLATDLTPVKSPINDDIPSDKADETPVGRRTRRATSMQKEISLPTTTKLKRSSSKVSLSEDSTDEPSTSRKTTRAKKTASTSKDTETIVEPKRSTRASSLIKDTSEKSDDVTAPTTRKNTRKRGGSVPKETPLETSTRSLLQRSRRGGSIIEDVIPEEPSENIEKPKRGRGKSSSKEGSNPEKTKSSSPTMSTRSRLSSITSIPEEVEQEEQDEDSDGEIFTWKGKSAESTKNTRLRRAASVDSPLIGVKRRTRTVSTRSAVVDEVIDEETSNVEATSRSKTKTAKKAPVKRKRTASASTSRQDVEEIVPDKLPPRRTRKVSQRSNDTETFRFSPPGKARDRPDDDNDDEKDTGEVPDYVFSPPHTRSRHVTSQPRRKMNRDFIPITEAEREAGRRAMEAFANRPHIKLSGQTRDPFVLYGPRKIFSFPKRSKSLTEASSRQDRKDQR